MTAPIPNAALAPVLAQITAERSRQDAKWGEQNHPDGTGGEERRDAAEIAKTFTDRAAEAGRLTWLLILREEFLEALAETDPLKLRTELVQLAAVAVQWIEAIDRRKPYGTGCHCTYLGEGTPEHTPSALCRSLRPDADRDGDF